MKAVVRQKYGNAENISVAKIPKPSPKANEILVQVKATTINRTDCAILAGKPFAFRLVIGLFKPKNPVLGCDFAGIVEEVGPEVPRFKKGDRVFGLSDEGIPSQAEFLCVNQTKAIAIIPEKQTFSEAVACLEGFHYAFNFANKVNLKAGQKVMVNGGTGAIGAALISICKSFGCEVVATCKAEHSERVLDLGADQTIDYLSEDFTQQQEKYDFVFDAVGKSTFKKCRNILSSKGVYISSELGPGMQNLFLPLWTKFFSKQKVIFPFPSKPLRSIEFAKKLIEADQFKPLIDRSFTPEQAVEAYRYVMSEKKVGNVILKMG